MLSQANAGKDREEMLLAGQIGRAFAIDLRGAAMAVLAIFAASQARADHEDDARDSQGESDAEVITPDLQKVQFDSSGQLQRNRPDTAKFGTGDRIGPAPCLDADRRNSTGAERFE
jgi:hypothetical protein